jgi:phage gpG-like protein
MSGARIQITVDGKEEFDRTFTRLDANFDDLTPIWPDVRDEFWRIEREQFDSEGSKGRSGKWARLSERYALKKIKRYGAGKKILEATGELAASLTGNAPGSYYSTTKKEIAVGTTLARGIYHQRGSDKLPKREPISFSDEQKRRMMKVIQGSLIKELRRGNFYIPVTDR